MIKDIANVLTGVSWARLSEPARQKLLLCLLADCSVAVAGLPYTRLKEPAASAGGHFLFSGRRTADPRQAAFFNAAVMHARTQDDFHPMGNLHVSTVLIPAAFACAEAHASSGEALLDALVAGYTAVAGLSRQFSERTTPKGLRSTGLYSPFSASAAASRLAGFDANQMGNALALTASLTGGLTQCWLDGSDEWQLHVASAAANGMLAANLTADGLRGGEHALDGKFGFYRAFADCQPKFADIAADFDPEHAVLDTVIKRYPTSGICQPVVRLAEQIAARHRPVAAAIERIDVVMNPFEMRYPGTLNKGPFRSFSDVLMSAAFCSASVFANGRFVFSDLFDLGRADRNRLIDATVVRDDAALPTLSCRIEIQLKGGGKISEEMINGGAGLAIDWNTVDEWASGLWSEAGRSEAQYMRFREAVRNLSVGSSASLIATLAP